MCPQANRPNCRYSPGHHVLAPGCHSHLPIFALFNRMCHCRVDSATPTHGKVDLFHNICAECFLVSTKKSDLEQHACSSGHTAFLCTCGARFSKAYTLNRHINSMVGPRFPCELCDDKSFPRRDKRDEHLRRFHRLGARAFARYKGGNSTPGSVSLPVGGTPPAQAGVLWQANPVAPGSGAMSMFNLFTPAADTAPDASPAPSGASPDSSTVSLNVPGSPTRIAPY